MDIKRIGFQVPSNITLIESYLKGFTPDEMDERNALLMMVQAAATPFVILDLPYHEYVKSFGRGFTVQVAETMQEKGLHVTILPVECRYWGSPVDQKRVFIIGGPHILEQPEEHQMTTYADWDDTAIYHTTVGMLLVKVQPGLFPTMEGVVASRLAALSEPKNYAGAPCLVARKSGNTYAINAITSSGWSKMYGIELNTDLGIFSCITPSSVLRKVFSWVASCKAPVMQNTVEEGEGVGDANDPAPAAS